MNFNHKFCHIGQRDGSVSNTMENPLGNSRFPPCGQSLNINSSLQHEEKTTIFTQIDIFTDRSQRKRIKYVFVSSSHKSLTEWNTSLPPYLHNFFSRINCLSNFCRLQIQGYKFLCKQYQNWINNEVNHYKMLNLFPPLFCDLHIKLWNILPAGHFYEIFCYEKKITYIQNCSILFSSYFSRLVNLYRETIPPHFQSMSKKHRKYKNKLFSACICHHRRRGASCAMRECINTFINFLLSEICLVCGFVTKKKHHTPKLEVFDNCFPLRCLVEIFCSSESICLAKK